MTICLERKDGGATGRKEKEREKGNWNLACVTKLFRGLRHL
jgi:hypothetical protein